MTLSFATRYLRHEVVGHGRKRAANLMALFFAVQVLACAQISVVRSGSFEVGGFVGASYGIDKFRYMGGGNLTYAINKYILPYVEYTYLPGIARSSTTPVGTTVIQGVALSDFHGGFHVRIPLRESPIVPYLAGGLGTLIARAGEETLQFQVFGENRTRKQSFAGGSGLAANAGGGLRFYIGQRFGFRAEAKIYKPISGLGPSDSRFNSTFGKVEGGIFIQLR